MDYEDNKLILFRNKVRSWIHNNKRVTYHSDIVGISIYPFNKTYKHDNRNRLTFSELNKIYSKSEISEVGIIDKLYEELVTLEIITKCPPDKTKHIILEKENKIISNYFCSSVVPDLSLVDFIEKFEPTTEQIAEAIDFLGKNRKWFNKISEEKKSKWIDQYLRHKYLNIIDSKKRNEHHEKIIKYLNENLTFFRVETNSKCSIADTYIDAVGVKSFEFKSFDEYSELTIEQGILFLERIGRSEKNDRNRFFATSINTILYHANMIPFCPYKYDENIESILNKTRMILCSLLKRTSLFSGKIGVRNRKGEKIILVCNNMYDRYLSNLYLKLPDKFIFNKYIKYSNHQNISDNETIFNLKYEFNDLEYEFNSLLQDNYLNECINIDINLISKVDNSINDCDNVCDSEEFLFNGDVFYEYYDNYGYNDEGVDKFGYDMLGVDRFGYSKYAPDGYDLFGYNQYGFDRLGYDRKGYNSNGYDRCGYDRKGYNSYGYDRCLFNREGYNDECHDRRGYSRSGCDIMGYDRNKLLKQLPTKTSKPLEFKIINDPSDVEVDEVAIEMEMEKGCYPCHCGGMVNNENAYWTCDTCGWTERKDEEDE